jgi:predicted PurR-regulated permease PerM
MEFRDYVAILSGLIGIFAIFIWIMGMLVQQINKRIDTVDKRIDDFRDNMDKRFDELRSDVDRRFGELREDMDRSFDELREEIKEIKLLLYKVLEVPHKQGE